MDNTIENAQLYFDELRHTEQPVFVPITTAGIMVAYTNKITASKDQRIAELEDKIRVLDFKLQGAYALWNLWQINFGIIAPTLPGQRGREKNKRKCQRQKNQLFK